jgi:hypothetical protein
MCGAWLVTVSIPRRPRSRPRVRSLGLLYRQTDGGGKHAKRLTEEFSITNVTELVDFADKVPASISGIVTSLRIRNPAF